MQNNVINGPSGGEISIDLEDVALVFYPHSLARVDKNWLIE
jgi:hypothetical protein